MVRTRGPAASIDAAGKLAGTLVFSSSAGRTYAKKLTKPAQPQTPLQISSRAVNAFLAKEWATLAPATKATWEEAALAEDIAPYHMYLKLNLRRFGTWLFPTQTYTPDLTWNSATHVSTQLVAHNRQIEVSRTITTVNYNWSLVWCRHTASTYTPSRTNLVHIQHATTTGKKTWWDGPLPPGTYYYRVASHAARGFRGSFASSVGITIP